MPDYIANGSNITYSVNKLFRRSIWEENSYKKMLFEDIALIPSLSPAITASDMSKAFLTIITEEQTRFPPHFPEI